MARIRRPAANFFTLALLTGSLILSGCAVTSGVSSNKSTPTDGKSATKTQKSFNQFPDIPVPTRANMDIERTLIFGMEGGWYGRLVMSSGHNVSATFDFYQQEMPGFGWQPVTMVRSAHSVLTYTRQGRVATIQIGEATLSGSEISITVSPKQTDTKGASAPMVTPVR
ncbi:hypothetical protein [Magnetospira sp. QH-2]|uniref:hypothetical protein n=1 Tax=Magnetospira sp. (strain QH-2) TaxID=1288970 RepID=UPI0005F9FC90|nr:hypothetical protein [Magnetospira sp. QH-2]